MQEGSVILYFHHRNARDALTHQVGKVGLGKLERTQF
jgi:hypothetical protein